MKQWRLRLAALVLSLILLFPVIPTGSAYVQGEPFRLDLSRWIENEQRREYVQMMLDYYIRTDPMVRSALDGGFSAVFLFDGCSDNLDDPVLSDLSYYRVSGICVVIKQDGVGNLRMTYFNDDCSTIPDRPLAYGAWKLPKVGEVGPATVCDGTYQLYSVYHKGRYEALNARTEYYDAKVDAVYMTEEGFVPARATEINVHTRTGNHILTKAMWSAGCPLVGDGKYSSNAKEKKLGFCYQALYSYKLQFAFRDECMLSYLNGKTFQVDHVWFAENGIAGVLSE